MGQEVSAPEHLRWLAELVELSPDALVVVDEAGQILAANHRVGQLFGYEDDDLTGMSVERLVPLRSRSAFGAQHDTQPRDPRRRAMGDRSLELPGLRQDGSVFTAEIAQTAVRTDHGTLTAATIRDLSERRRAERERADLVARLKREQTAAQASRMESVGQLAGGIAHDFNNLLSVVMGNVEFLTAQLAPDTPEHEEALEILHASRRAATLTKQLLMFSRREVVEPEPVDLNETVTDVQRLLRRAIGEHVALVTDLAVDLPLVMGDPGSLEQILVNLAVNARDAMPSGGTLTIATRAAPAGAAGAAHPAELDAGDYVTLSVTDTGVGMSSEVAARAFEPFFSTKPKTHGTGLGLATVYAVALQLRGYVSIQSELGQGTTVTVEFPRLREPTLSEPSLDAGIESAGRPGNQEHVLLVEDDRAVRRVAEMILQRSGYRVTSASSGAEALELLECPEVAVDVLITDVIMPGMLGPELAERARALHPTLPVVLMSGYVDPQVDLRRFSDAAMVEKPFTEASLTRALRGALR